MADRFTEKAREVLHGLTAINEHLGYQFTQPLMAAKEALAQALREERAAGLDKAAEIARYHRDKYGDKAYAAWVAACNEVEVSCLATAGRIRRGEYENPTFAVMGALDDTGAEKKEGED